MCSLHVQLQIRETARTGKSPKNRQDHFRHGCSNALVSKQGEWWIDDRATPLARRTPIVAKSKETQEVQPFSRWALDELDSRKSWSESEDSHVPTQWYSRPFEIWWLGVAEIIIPGMSWSASERSLLPKSILLKIWCSCGKRIYRKLRKRHLSNQRD